MAKDKAEASSVRPYGFAPDFEALIAYYACTRPKFWSRVGHVLEPEAFGADPVKLAMTAARAIAASNGGGPSSVVVVLQRLTSWEDDGRITAKEIRRVRNFFAEVIDQDALAPEAEVISEVLPSIKKRLSQAALDDGYKSLITRGDALNAEKMLSRVKRLGASDVTIGTRLDRSAFDGIRRLGALRRLSTGIEDLDTELNGGWREKQLLMYLGPPGGGKSMALAHTAANAAVLGLNVGVVTLELSEEEQFARICANLVNLPTNDILDDLLDEAEDRVISLQEKNLFGFVTVKFMTPYTTTVQDVKDWIIAEREAGTELNLVVIDYADKLGVAKREGETVSSYLEMRDVYEGCRGLMYDEELPHVRWVATGSQVKGEALNRKKTKKIEGHHGSDSQHKIRIADVAVSINPREEELLFHIAKNRSGRAGADVGPLPTDFEYGRIVPVSRVGWPF